MCKITTCYWETVKRAGECVLQEEEKLWHQYWPYSLMFAKFTREPTSFQTDATNFQSVLAQSKRDAATLYVAWHSDLRLIQWCNKSWDVRVRSNVIYFELVDCSRAVKLQLCSLDLTSILNVGFGVRINDTLTETSFTAETRCVMVKDLSMLLLCLKIQCY